MNVVTSNAAAIEGAFRAIDVSRGGRFWWCDERVDWFPARFLTGLSSGERQALTKSALAACLYENFYRCGGLRPLPPGMAGDDVTPDPIQRDRLAGANTGSGSWQPGWEIVGADARGCVRVRRDGLTLIAMPHEILQAGGQHVSVRRPKNLPALSPGFHTANLDGPRDPHAPSIRLYWHLVAAGAEHFIHAVTLNCNEAGIGGSLKVVNDRSQYDRCDSAVVYLSLGDVLTHADVIHSIHAELSPYLLPETPAMTLKLDDGLAVAQDPGGGESFGQHRCRLIAEAALRRSLAKAVDRHRVDHVAEVFAAAKVSPDQPHCRWESNDSFARIAGQWNSTPTAC